jgi:2,3-bisphosphoglycerate-independent phosphoglycerate mutase
MDGVGLTDKVEGNAFKNANTPNLDKIMSNSIAIHAHGTYVGLPSDEDMGNSEVGHNAMGCGQIYSQGAKLVNDAIESGVLFEGNTWKEAIEYAKDNKLHFIGLLSDGGVHSHINHLLKMIENAKKDGIKDVCVHILLDGRDVPKTSALEYVDILENKLKELNDDSFYGRIVSGGGRMNITMDRYEADWSMVEKGWHTHVLGEGRKFNSATEAITTDRNENLDIIDQYLNPFIIDNTNGTIEDHDSVIFFNFRGDRAIEISRAFDEENFDKFDRVRVPNVYYAGMLQYDSEVQIPKHFITEPPHITNTLTEQLIKYNINEYAVSETQKYGHVTYFWNGNKIDKFNDALETYDKVDSDVIPFDQAPAMKANEITDRFIDAIKSNKYQFLRCNFPNGDMVGHTGNYDATVKAMEAVDYNIGRIMNAVDETNSILIVLADHGNAEEMIDDKGAVKTSHTTNPVPFIIYGNNIDNINFKQGDFGLANLASTITDLLNVESNPVWKESIIEIKKN